MNIQQIIKEIDILPNEGKVELYTYLGQKLRKREHLKSVLESVKGSGQGIWNQDAQEYVNEQRSNDRN